MITGETTVQIQVADYLTLQYPSIIFHSDFGSGVKLNKIQAALQKRLNGGRKSYPDMFIAEPIYVYSDDKTPLFQSYKKRWGGDLENDDFYDTEWLELYALHYMHPLSGLYLELKKDGTKLIRDKDARKILKGETKLRKQGDWWDLHTEEQALMLEQLRQRGYCAEFAVGFDEAKKIIDEYLKGYKNEKVEF